MDENPRRSRSPWILILGLLLVGLSAYAVLWRGGILKNLAGIVFDLILILIFIQVAVFFYAQFTLPVQTLKDRLRVNSRVWLHWRRSHGPTIFVRNGREVASPGELNRAGPGLIWIDTASAVVTWSGLGQKRVLGPGVHFTEADQKIGRTFSLHTQTCSLGPSPEDPVFATPDEQASDEQRKSHSSMQGIRTAVSGHTRDGIEVVPQINLTFRLDSARPGPGQAGSRFGFSAVAVERASRAEGVNAEPGGKEQSWVAWNQLPGLMAIDLWREYLSKFTLDELFQASFGALPEVPQPSEPAEPVRVPSKPLVTKRGLATRLLRRLNNALESRLNRAAHPAARPIESARPSARSGESSQAGKRFTAFQIIQEMVERRLRQAAVPVLDECGRALEGHTLSPEFARLKERGLAVESLTIQNLRFEPAVEAQITQLWNTSWLADAETERQQVEQLERLAAQNGRQQALLQHAALLSRAVQHDQPKAMEEAVKSLLRAMEFEIVADPRLYAQATEEAVQVSNLVRWVESGQGE